MCSAPPSVVMFVTLSSNGEIAGGTSAWHTATDTRGSRANVADLLVRLDRVDDHVPTMGVDPGLVVCGEPSGINVVTKHGFAPRSSSTRRSGRSIATTLVEAGCDEHRLGGVL